MKELIGGDNLNWNEEIKQQHIGEKVNQEMKKKLLKEAKDLRIKIKVKSSISAAELIREDREHEH